MMHPVCNGYAIWQIVAVQWNLVGFLIINVYANLQVYEGWRHFDGSLLALIEISFESAVSVILHYNCYHSFLKKENFVVIFEKKTESKDVCEEEFSLNKNHLKLHYEQIAIRTIQDNISRGVHWIDHVRAQRVLLLVLAKIFAIQNSCYCGFS